MNKQNIFCAVVYIILFSSFSSSFFSYTKSFKAPRIDAPTPSASAFPVIEHNVDLAQTREITNKILDKVCELDIVVTVTSFETKCDMLITQADIPLNITEPGLYCLMENVTFDASAPAITIDADCVTIDLCQHAMDGQGVGEVGIEIVGGSDVITIHNGTIKNFDNAAIQDNGNDAKTTNLIIRDMNLFNQTGGSLSLNFCSNATVNNLSNVLIEDCHFDQVEAIAICGDEIILRGIQASTTIPSSPFFLMNPNALLEQGQQVFISDCVLNSESGGVVVRYTQNVIVKNCEIVTTSVNPYNIINCENVYIHNCIGTSSDTIFRVVTGQIGNPTQMQTCVLEDCIANDGLGFRLESRQTLTLANTKLINCCSNNSLTNGFSFQSDGFLDNLVVENCVAQNSTEAGFEIETELGADTIITNVEFNNCIAQQSGGDGFSFVLYNAGDTLDHAVFKNCIAQTSLGNDGPTISYDGDGFAFGTSSQSNGSFGDIIMIDCLAQNNADDGFEFDNTNTLIMKNCVANLNGDNGFNIVGSSLNNLFNIVLKQCAAQGNGAEGFDFANLQNITIKNSISQENGETGFEIDDSNNVALIDCQSLRDGALDGGPGIDLNDSTNIIIDSCVVMENEGEGFVVSSSMNINITNCQAIENNDDGFYIQDSGNVVIENCKSLENTESGLAVDGSVSSVNNYKILDCSFINNGETGCEFLPTFPGSVENFVIENCLAQDNGTGGFMVIPSTTQMNHIVFKNCVSQSNRAGAFPGNGFGINVGFSPGNVADVVFENCVSQNNADHGFDMIDSATVTMKNCIANENASDGFQLINTAQIYLENCVGQQNGDDGISIVNGPENAVLTGCVVQDNVDRGIQILACNNVVLNGCLAQDNGKGLTPADGIRFTLCTNVAVNNSVSQDNGDHGFIANGPTNIIFDQCQSFSNTAQGFLFNDPQNLVMKACQAIGNIETGFEIATTELKQDFTFIECCSIDNNGHGYLLSTNDNDIEHIIFRDCVAQDNADEGFSLQCGAQYNAINDVIFEHCLAQGNRGESTLGNGFDVGDTDGMVGTIQHIAFENCIAQENANDGFGIEDVDHVALHNCVAQNNIANGFRFIADDVLLKDCRSQSNGIDGFEFEFVDGVSVQACKAFSNTAKGFDLVDTATGNFSKCRASTNGAQGFDLSATVTCIKIIDGCAVGNTTIGFEDNSPLGSNVLFGNVAFCNDVSNYAGSGINSVFIAIGPDEIAAASRWDNVSA